MAVFEIEYDNGGYNVMMHMTFGRYGTLDEATAALDAMMVADKKVVVRPSGNSKTVKMGKLLTEVGADIGDEVYVMVMTGVME